MKTRLDADKTGTPQLEMNRILVPVDFSDAEGEALVYAVPLANDTGAKIVLLHVIEPVYASAGPGPWVTCRSGRRRRKKRPGN